MVWIPVFTSTRVERSGADARLVTSPAKMKMTINNTKPFNLSIVDLLISASSVGDP